MLPASDLLGHWGLVSLSLIAGVVHVTYGPRPGTGLGPGLCSWLLLLLIFLLHSNTRIQVK